MEINENGEVYINNEKLEEPYAIETTGKAKSFKVPDGLYLFLGDNRSISRDARDWNNPYISEDKIIGKAEFRFFPLNRIGKVE